ncbi:MAG: BamA/TamA family outer membrane protein [Ignavibacteriae bacterium]|nr:BamA/TamA family outer membrane protein [Ignavibacteriota bacterium]
MKALLHKLILLFLFFPTFVFPQETLELKLFLKEKKLPFGITKLVPQDKPEVSLVLSGGGSRALSHIGVLRALKELEIPIDQIIGTSMGSVIGGLYSAGYTIEEMDSIVKVTNWDEFFSLIDADRRNLFVDQKITEDKSLLTVRLNGFKPSIPTSINTGKKISNFLTSLTINAPINHSDSFDNLLYKFRAVCTDLVSGKRTVINNGLLSEAMRASSSVSFLLPPVKRDSLILVDGGLVDNLPIKTAEELNPDFIIASDATSSLRNKNELEYPWEIADQLVTIPSRIIWEENISKANILIKQNLKDRKNDNFENLDEIINSGFDSAKYLLLSTKNELTKIFRQKLSKDEKYFHNISLPEDPNILEKEIFEKYKEANSFSKTDILCDLYKFQERGIYNNLSAVSNVTDSSTVININYQINSKIKNFELIGITQIPVENALKHFDNILNKPYSADEIVNSSLELIKQYRKLGFVLATIDLIYFSSDLEKLYVTINEGQITEIEVEGNETTLNSVVTREFASDVGDFLLKKNLDEGLENISATDLFDNVKLSFVNNGLGKKIKIELQEKLPNVLRLGLRIDNENFTQFAVDLRNENLFGTGSELGFSLSGGIRNRSFLIEHKTNRIFNTYLTYKAQVFYNFNDVKVYADDDIENRYKFSRSEVGEYRQIFFGGFVGVGAHLKKLGTLTAEGKYQVDEIKSVTSISSDQTYKIDISSLKLRLQIDSQNKYPFPTKGLYINTFYETAQKILGGDISFAKFNFDYSGYVSINNHTIKPRFIFGFADETLPLSQQFDFGGQKNFFGYREYEFRGRQIFISSLEYRYKLPIQIYVDTYLKLRYDLGSSWNKQEQIQFNDLKHGLGLSLSLDTPIGPADFSVGRSLYLKDTSPERILSRGPFMFYFTIGYYY